MKAKKILAVTALTLAATTLTACGNDDQSIELNRYWQQNSTLSNQTIDETLTYDVKFEKKDASLVNYSLDYSNGLYTTHLYSDSTKTDVFHYETELSIDVTYTYKSESVTLRDSVKTSVIFDASNGIRPLSSEKQILSNSPNNVNATKVSHCYETYQRRTKTLYDGDEGKTSVWKTVTDKDGNESEKLIFEDDFSAKNGKYTYVDNECLLLALRCISSSETSAKVNVYNPLNEAKQRIKITFTDDEDYSAEFSYFDYAANPAATEKTKKTIAYREAGLKLSATNSGATQTAWIAKATDTSKNTNRNVILKLETPLSYGLGSLVYTLKSVKR